MSERHCETFSECKSTNSMCTRRRKNAARTTKSTLRKTISLERVFDIASRSAMTLTMNGFSSKQSSEFLYCKECQKYLNTKKIRLRASVYAKQIKKLLWVCGLTTEKFTCLSKQRCGVERMRSEKWWEIHQLEAWQTRKKRNSLKSDVFEKAFRSKKGWQYVW